MINFDTASETEQVWAAGILSVLGSIVVAKVKKPTKEGHSAYARMQVGSTTHKDAIQRLGQILGTNVNVRKQNGKDFAVVIISGDQLHKVMTQLWPHIARDRKLEYKAARKTVKELTQPQEVEID